MTGASPPLLFTSVCHAQGQLPFMNRPLHHMKRWLSGRSERRVGKGRSSPCNFRVFRVKLRRRVIVTRSSVRCWKLKRLNHVQSAVSRVFPTSVYFTLIKKNCFRLLFRVCGLYLLLQKNTADQKV